MNSLGGESIYVRYCVLIFQKSAAAERRSLAKKKKKQNGSYIIFSTCGTGCSKTESFNVL